MNRRLPALIRKEFIQVVRDPSSIAIAFVLPVILLLLFGYGVSLDAKRVPLALIAERPSPETQSLFSGFYRSGYFVPVPMADMAGAERLLVEGDIKGIVYLQSDFLRRLKTGGAPIQLIVNGIDANTARLVQGYVTGVWLQWLQRRALEERLPPAPAIDLQQRIWYNPEVESRNFLVPGLIAVIMTLIGALLTSMVIAREWERGTMEALMSTPVTMGEILLGKIGTYFLLGTGGLLLAVAMAVWLFQVPLRGSFWLLWLGSSLFLLVALGMGLLISTVAKNQFVAGQIAIITAFLPAFILSGLIFEIGSMPTAIQWLTWLIPARYYVAILQTVFLAGDIWPVLWPNLAALVLMAAFFLGRTRQLSRKRLE
ncbi:ABC-2 type transport system permease protein [Methylomarinovum caldicuralii]|uniref:ABC-2 type transport system permease protein n=1 Tax=Methylomarinovum caldicuralii TaxID=438856 RepID=A0AAU9C2V7_9GAMM|nr:ABC transporter permease [Methylomarinovum caldicuralii]BCX81958.1 ABC-2 type transport system permease protein [Methylomarinovum caldicuralii]